MSDDNVISFGDRSRFEGEEAQGALNQAVIETLMVLLEKAERGEISCIGGAGLWTGGRSFFFAAGEAQTPFEMLGALAWVQRGFEDKMKDAALVPDGPKGAA